MTIDEVGIRMFVRYRPKLGYAPNTFAVPDPDVPVVAEVKEPWGLPTSIWSGTKGRQREKLFGIAALLECAKHCCIVAN